MNEVLLIIICFIVVIYFTLIGTILICDIYCYYKDGNKKGTNLKGRALRSAIRHELVHARIANIFGFTDWKIIHKSDSLACRIEIDYDIMNWKLLFNFFKMYAFHFVFDVGGCIIWLQVMGICEYIQSGFLDVKMVINNFMENKNL